ncbi:MAG: phosphoribosylamine--glycine ligase [Christensenellaceae bacterium]|nr:phosphoribosylamine--glycine ligase [Christensenellaceae bacterium]
MKILVVGSGGREHAIIWKLRQNPKITEIHCAPGNGGIADMAECVPIKATDIPALVDYAEQQRFGLVVVAPDDPLYMGLVDALQQKGIRAFGPTAAGARLEGSKVYAKHLMKKYGIPTARYEVFSHYDAACAYVKTCPMPTVVKADGLALGKGVIICQTVKEAQAALDDIMQKRVFGDAGSRVVIEEYMTGPEVSVLAFCDGKTILPMASAQDHKRAYDNDQGPNTGGMGAFSPSPKYTDAVRAEVEEKIIRRTLDALKREGEEFKGVLYFGLMLTGDGPKVLEYNARFGDPEAQAVLPRMKNDLLDMMDAVIDGRLHEVTLEWDERSAVCVVLASGGYPGSYPKGLPISGLEQVKDAIVFHAGTARQTGGYVTAGGRVLGVTAMGKDIAEARLKAYSEAEKISFEGMHYRRDIGVK